MRVTGYGTGFGQQDGSRDRAAAFRARHSIGQRIKGRILRREQNGLSWVQVGGEELLARLEVQAEPGDQLIFIVRALTPEIMLQALAGGASAGDVPGLVQRFRAAREVFEVNDAALLMALRIAPPHPALRLEAFQLALSRMPMPRPATSKLRKSWRKSTPAFRKTSRQWPCTSPGCCPRRAGRRCSAARQR